MARAKRSKLLIWLEYLQSSAAQNLDDMSLGDGRKHSDQESLTRAGGNVSHAADALGLSRGALYRRIRENMASVQSLVLPDSSQTYPRSAVHGAA